MGWGHRWCMGWFTGSQPVSFEKQDFFREVLLSTFSVNYLQMSAYSCSRFLVRTDHIMQCKQPLKKSKQCLIVEETEQLPINCQQFRMTAATPPGSLRVSRFLPAIQIGTDPISYLPLAKRRRSLYNRQGEWIPGTYPVANALRRCDVHRSSAEEWAKGGCYDRAC